MATELVPGSPSWARPYRSGRLWAVLVSVMLALLALYFLLVIVIVTFPDPFLSVFDQNGLMWMVRWGEVPLIVAGGLCFLAWFARSYRNLPALGGQNLRWSPRSAVLWWFVPFANFFMPYRITMEIWRVTSQARGAAAGRGLLLSWWMIWLVTRIFGNATRTTDQSWVAAVHGVLEITAVALALAVVWSIQVRQDSVGRPTQQIVAAPFPGPVSSGGEPERSRTGVLVLVLVLGAIGCLVAVFVVVGVVGFFRSATANCPPQDFPVYANAQQTDFNYTAATDGTDCTVGWESTDTADQLSAFYNGSLDTGSWQVVSKDEKAGEWYFQRRYDPTTIGKLRLLAHGSQSRVEVEIKIGQSPLPSVQGSPSTSPTPADPVALLLPALPAFYLG